jgi:hypothetical protein
MQFNSWKIKWMYVSVHCSPVCNKNHSTQPGAAQDALRCFRTSERITQWGSVTSQKTGILNLAVMKASKLAYPEQLWTRKLCPEKDLSVMRSFGVPGAHIVTRCISVRRNQYFGETCLSSCLRPRMPQNVGRMYTDRSSVATAVPRMLFQLRAEQSYVRRIRLQLGSESRRNATLLNFRRESHFGIFPTVYTR